MKINSFFKSSIIGGALLFSGPVLAGGYGPAGCGLGTMLLGDDATGFKGGITMVINNMFWGPTSVTLGVLNCGDGAASLDAEGMDFVTSNRALLSEDSAKNADGSLVVLAEVMQCTQQEAFVTALQSDHMVFSGTNDEVFNKINDLATKTCNSAM